MDYYQVVKCLDSDQANSLSGLIWVQTVCKSCQQIFLPSADFFQNQFVLKNSFWNTIRVSNVLDSDHALQFVGPDLGPNCLQVIFFLPSADFQLYQL